MTITVRSDFRFGGSFPITNNKNLKTCERFEN